MSALLQGGNFDHTSTGTWQQTTVLVWFLFDSCSGLVRSWALLVGMYVCVTLLSLVSCPILAFSWPLVVGINIFFN
jgi:hypothetical protein